MIYEEGEVQAARILWDFSEKIIKEERAKIHEFLCRCPSEHQQELKGILETAQEAFVVLNANPNVSSKKLIPISSD